MKPILLALIFCGLGLAQPALVDSAASNTQTTSAIDTTGASLTIISVSAQDSAPTVSDTKGNTYTQLLTFSGDGTNRIFVFYCLSPIVGPSHAFTTSAGSGAHDIAAGAYSGVSALDPGIFNVGGTTGTLTARPGSITPSVDGDLLIVAATAGSGAYPNTIDAPFHPACLACVNGNGMAYYVQPTAAAINPEVQYVIGGASTIVAIAAFKASAVTPSAVRHRVTSQ